MSVQIKFSNEAGSFITAQQVTALTRYNKITYESGSIKTIEHIGLGLNKDRKIVSYYMSPTENKSSIRASIFNDLSDVNCIIYFDQQSSHGFNLWSWESYSINKELTFKGNVVYDDKQRTIFYCTFNLISNELKDGCSKHFYQNALGNEFNDRLLTVVYNSDGSVDEIFDVNENFGYVKGISLSEFLADTNFSQVEFQWSSHPYYHSAYPFLPNNNTI